MYAQSSSSSWSIFFLLPNLINQINHEIESFSSWFFFTFKKQKIIFVIKNDFLHMIFYIVFISIANFNLIMHDRQRQLDLNFFFLIGVVYEIINIEIREMKIWMSVVFGGKPKKQTNKRIKWDCWLWWNGIIIIYVSVL